MKITRALKVLELDKLPVSREKIEEAYKRLAKRRHPDVGGSEAAFKELNTAYQQALRALDFIVSKKQEPDAETILKRKRDKMRDEMLKRRAKEDHLRNVQATKWITGIVAVLAVIAIVAVARPYFIGWMVQRNPIQQMSTVTYSDRTDKFMVSWEWKGKSYSKVFKGRLVDGRWLISSSGMPVLLGNEYVIKFNANAPNYAVLEDQFISPATAEVYYNIVRHSMSDYLKTSTEDPKVVCLYWNVLERFGVDGLSHFLFSETTFLRNWYHNEHTFEGLVASEEFQKLYRSCTTSQQ